MVALLSVLCVVIHKSSLVVLTVQGEVHKALQRLAIFLSSLTQMVSRHKNNISYSLGYVRLQFPFSDEAIQYLANFWNCFYYPLYFWLKEANLPASYLLIEKVRTWHAHCCLAMPVHGFDLKISLLLKIAPTNKTVLSDVLRWSHFFASNIVG